MQPRMPLRAQRRPKYNEVLRDARVNDVHCTHRPARIVEHPFAGIGVDGDLSGGVCQGEVGDNVLDHPCSFVWRGGNGGFGELVKARWVKNIPLVLETRNSGQN